MTRVSTIAVAAAVTGLFAAATPAHAVEWPWCADMFDRNGTATNCGFVSRAQCEEYISGMNGWCYPNPFYREQRPAPRRRRN